jgi:hypothetical protein
VGGGGGDVREVAIGRGGETEHEPLDRDKHRAVPQGHRDGIISHLDLHKNNSFLKL